MALYPTFVNRITVMCTASLYLFYLITVLPCINADQSPSPYKPTDLILVNSGAPLDGQSLDQRSWVSDAKSKFCPSDSEISQADQASEQGSVDAVPYMTARFIRSTFTCTFPVSVGPKFIRLYFNPTTYSAFNASDSFFRVTANEYTLLRNFSAYLTASAMRPPTTAFFKEFLVTVWDHQELNLTFVPSPSSFAFINGIEIVSMPNNLYTSNISNDYRYVNGLLNSYHFDNTTSLENVYRLNVGGQEVVAVADTGMFRTWYDDFKYLSPANPGIVHKGDNATIEKEPAYVAPDIVYLTKRTLGPYANTNKNSNLTWLFSVDPGFGYLLRFHFCETEPNITKENERPFFIYINDMTAEVDADVIYWSGGRQIAVYKDYIVSVPGESHKKQNLSVCLQPNTQLSPAYFDVILNGLEIFKLNNSDGNLGGPNPEAVAVPPPPQQYPVSERGNKSIRSTLVVAVVLPVIGIVLALCILSIYRRKMKAKDTGTITAKFFALSLPTDLCRQFTMLEIREFTKDFHDQNVIGRGGFGTVYKGYIGTGSIPVAIKRLDSSSRQGIHEFHTEIEMLSRLRHAHLVSLIGYCADQGEMILVYEFMPNGNVQDHLYGKNNPPIPWKQRLQICIGAARGLHYLHTGAKYTIIHRDVKTSNILLDKNWVAKVSDFGLSKTGPNSESQTHVSTVVKGSFGYVDPEYYRLQHLSEKSDVYSFGVVLLEILCARRPVISTLPKEQVNLVQWARNCYQSEALDRIIDSRLKDDILYISLKKFVEIAESCVRDKANERPTMGDIVWRLEFALQLQETAEENMNSGEFKKNFAGECRELITTEDDGMFMFSSGPTPDSHITFSPSEWSASNGDPDKKISGTVFSEIMNPGGR